MTLVALGLSVAACDEPGTGSPTCRRGTARITVFQGPGGECLPRSRVVGYRCEGRDPLVVLGAGSDDERRFLGGRFGVPVGALPEGSEVIGVGDGAQLVSVLDEPRRLYTVRGATITRWLALPEPAATVIPSAFMLGDSLLDGGAPAILAALPDWAIEVDALNGRGSAAGAAIAEARTADEPVVVVELGTNDQSADGFAANASRILRAFRSVPLVVWQNVQGPPDLVPVADEINAELVRQAGRRPNVSIADWDGTVAEEILFDGVHPDPDHQDAMADLLAPMLTGWLGAVAGPAACE